jgi:CHAT domain-containing protein/tetratricopeptide (TPR) repeat protein
MTGIEPNAEVTQETIDTLNKGVIELIQQGNNDEALNAAKVVLAAAGKVLGVNHASTGDSMNNLAFLYAAQGNNEEAEQLYLGAVACYADAVGRQHPSSIAATTNLVALYLKTGKLESALPLAEAMREVISATLGEDTPQYADNTATLALTYSNLGRLEEAEPLLLQAIRLNRRHLGEDHPIVAELIETLGMLYSDTGRKREAGEWLEQALAIKRRTIGEENEEYLDMMAAVVAIQFVAESPETALPRAERLRELQERVLGEDHPSYFNTLQLLASMYLGRGNYAEAEPLFHKVLEHQRTTVGEETAEYATTLNLLATLFSRTGAFEASERCLVESLSIRRKVLGEDHEDVAQSLNNLAIHWRKFGKYKEGIPLIQEAVRIHRSRFGEDHWQFALDLFYLGDHYHSIGDYKSAEPCFLRALEIQNAASEVAGAIALHKAITLNALAKLYMDRSDLERAEDYARQAVEAFRQTEGERGPYYITALGNLATIYTHREKYDEASELFEQAIGLAQQGFVPEHVSILNGAGMLALRQRNYEAAEIGLRAAVDAYRSLIGESNPQLAAALSNLMLVCAATKRYGEALEIAKEIARINDHLINQAFSLGSEAQRMSYVRHIQSEFLVSMSLVSQHLIDNQDAVVAAMNHVLRRKAIGAEALAAQRDSVLGGLHPDLEPLFRELAEVRTRISQMTVAGPPWDSLDAYRQALAELNARRVALETQLASRVPEIGLEKMMREVDLESVAAALPAGSALVEFIHFFDFDFDNPQTPAAEMFPGARYAAFVLPAGRPQDLRMINLGDADEIDRLLARMRDAIIAETEQPVDAANFGDALRQAVFDPLLPALSGIRRLLLAPEADLSRLPFEILPSADGCRLIDDYHISYLSTGRDLPRFGSTFTGKASDPVVVADPDFDLAAASGTAGDSASRASRDLEGGGLKFEALPATRVEAERIAAMLGVAPLIGSVALESTVKSRRSPWILHLATHGFFLEDQPATTPQNPGVLGADGLRLESDRLSGAGMENPLLRSGLALAGANTWLARGALPDEAEDGLLNAEDVTGMDLLATDLVVLSACETGLGEIKTGEGVFGLRRAFVLAGAKTLVVSLWKVPDEETQRLMTDFYHRILSGQPRADALREAQLAMKAKDADPFFWGAFICHGDPGPLAPGSR